MVDQEFCRQAEQMSDELVRKLVQGGFECILRNSSLLLQKRHGPETLRDSWNEKTLSLGRWHSCHSVESRWARQFLFVKKRLQFESGELPIQFAFDNHFQLISLRFLEPQVITDTHFPSYVRPEAFVEHEMQCGTQEWLLPSVYSQPTGSGPFPAILLLHGSGAQDRDGRVGACQPLKDIADGLASRGIAVLRFDKRTLHYRKRLALKPEELTTEDECTRDAVAMLGILRMLPGVDRNKLYVAGHSLGGALLPRIVAREDRVAGMIMMAAPARPISTLIYEQARHLLTAQGESEAGADEKLAPLKAQVDRANGPLLTRNTPASELPLGLGANYWIDLRGYQPAVQAASLAKPCLILQGERDYQVTLKDFDMWQEALMHNPGSRFRSFPLLNHLFVRGEGPSLPDEYNRPGWVDGAVIEAITQWILR